MANGYASRMALINHQPVHKPCAQCGSTYYVAPYARGTDTVLCSRSCWDIWISKLPKEEYDELRQNT